ncbi:HEAT repeat protein [Xylariaceae sp. FL0804]|nr:HEAT repeat protein [Xylariaceae sp. FL0804]
MASDASAARKEFFKELKPRCVSINDLAVRSSDRKASAKDLIKVTEDLSALLDRQIAQDASILDEKLADYVFFPLSNILRHQQEYPIRLTELIIKCMSTLVTHGWKEKIPKELSQQLLILLTFIIGGVPGRERRESIPEETELEAFRGLSALFKASGSSLPGAAALVEADAIPSLGHAVTVILDGITEGRTAAIQFEALGTLDALCAAVRDRSALATFLPGTVSSLSRLLAPPTALKTQRRVLVRGIKALGDVLIKVLADVTTMTVLQKPETHETEDGSDGKVLSASWYKVTSAKVKLALASVLKLRSHDAEVVQSALKRLCIDLLDQCHQSLADCAPILVETAMMLSSDEEESSVYETTLTDLARIHPELSDTIKDAVYKWITSLPRVMQSKDEEVKQRGLRNVLKGQHFITTLQIDSSILGDSLADSLRDSTTALLLTSKPTGGLSEMPSHLIELGNTELARRGEAPMFQPILIAQEAERATRATLLDFMSRIGTPSQRASLAGDMLSYVRDSSGPTQIACYWLALELSRTQSQPSEMDDFLDLSSAADASDGSEQVFQELYSFSVGVLDSQAKSEEVDWRMQALALEVTTFAALRMKESFRPELIDVLYPIATFLGSGVPQLRDHAIISLNSIAASCGYDSVTSLIIDNVDYMVNSVSLRLNTFDISPASTQVLRMMIKLTGPRLIPYLDDVVASIFAALDNYHGYTLFVESLFTVLSEVVLQGSKSDKLLVEGVASASSVSQAKGTTHVPSVEELCDVLDKRIERKRKLQEIDLEPRDLAGHPKRPWKSDTVEEQAEEGEEEASGEVEKPPPPKTPTYQLLSRITNLTQHYLTSPTPTLRKSLLDLLSTVFPALAPDEGAFLPLVNSVWPVLVERLYDPEPFVAVAACEALSELCRSAGDFLNTRFKTEWWRRLGRWCAARKAEAEAAAPGPKGPRANKGRHAGSSVVVKGTAKARGGEDTATTGILIPIRARDGFGSSKQEGSSSALEITESSSSSPADAGGLGRFTQAARVWDAARGLLTAVVAHVGVDDDVFDEVALLLADSLAAGAAPSERAALDAADADAVWLLLYERGLAAPEGRRPQGRGMRFIRA